jgi:hypothetical protein
MGEGIKNFKYFDAVGWLVGGTSGWDARWNKYVLIDNFMASRNFC